MRPSSNSGRRPRGRPNRKHGPGQPGRNQSLDSSGPEGRIRGNASQIYERYLSMARDARSSGDRVAAETYFQHAEHYYRVVNDSTDPEPLNPGPRPHRGEGGNGQDAESAGNGRGHSEAAARNPATVDKGDHAQSGQSQGGHSQGGQTKGPSKGPSPSIRDDTPIADSAVSAAKEPLAQPAIAGLEPQPDLAESIPAAIPLAAPVGGSGEEPVKPRRGRLPRKRLTTKHAAARSEAGSESEAASEGAASDGGAPATEDKAEKA